MPPRAERARVSTHIIALPTPQNPSRPESSVPPKRLLVHTRTQPPRSPHPPMVETRLTGRKHPLHIQRRSIHERRPGKLRDLTELAFSSAVRLPGQIVCALPLRRHLNPPDPDETSPGSVPRRVDTSSRRSCLQETPSPPENTQAKRYNNEAA